MDARKKHQMQYIYQVAFQIPHEEKVLRRYGKNDAVIWKGFGNGAAKESEKEAVNAASAPDIGQRKRPVIVGMGPAGLFAALELAEHGVAPLVLERGCEVEKRRKKVSRFWDTGELDENCNVQFGEGGAGTFSDGKLNTLVKDPTGRGRRVMETFVRFGAPEEILYLQKPHIGTDILKDVVASIRKEIESLGGEVHFRTKVCDILCEKISGSVAERERAEAEKNLYVCGGDESAQTEEPDEGFFHIKDRRTDS